jgi:hypothetical protein
VAVIIVYPIVYTGWMSLSCGADCVPLFSPMDRLGPRTGTS